MFVTTHKMRVRYAETDRMGYAYYGNYPTYFEVARVEALRTLGIRYADIESSGVMLQAFLRAAESTLSTKYTTSRQSSAPRAKPPWFLPRPKRGDPPRLLWPFLKPWLRTSRESLEYAGRPGSSTNLLQEALRIAPVPIPYPLHRAP